MTTSTIDRVSPLKTRAARELARLGDDPDRIADALWLADARGSRHDESGNPVARYLRRLLRLGTGIRVSSASGRVQLSEGTVVPLPTAVREFLDRFDLGLYPNLEAW